MVRQQIQELNSKIDLYFGPEKPDIKRLYRRILTEAEFDRALHFGSGRDKRKLGSELESHGEVIAIDPDINGLKQNTVQKRVLGDGQRLPFANQTFDLCFSEYVFEHLPNPQSALEEIDRVLKPGGSFVVLVPNPRHYFARVGDFTPFWFHQFWLKLQGRENIEQDVFPTQYEWGTYSDVTDVDLDWNIEEFHSLPGPTGYTKILPFHIFFVLFDRIMADRPEHHVSYLVHYTV